MMSLLLVGVLSALPIGQPWADAGYELARKSGCLECHSLTTDKTLIGPAWQEVAGRYQHDPDARYKLVASILRGSSGKWDPRIYMSAQRHISQPQAERLVDYILSQTP